jgi:hypothetical protein
MNGLCRRGLNNSLQEMQRKAFHEIAVTVITVLARQMLAQSPTVILHALWKQRRGNEWSCFIHIGYEFIIFYGFEKCAQGVEVESHLFLFLFLLFVAFF